MSEHAHPDKDRLELGDSAWPLYRASLILAAAGIIAALFFGAISSFGFRRFYFAYLTAFCFFLSIALGALFFVLMQYLTRAGWSVGVRRTAENIAGTLPILGLLSIPILVSVAMQRGELYRWALPLSAAAPGALDKDAEETPPPPNLPGADTAPAHPMVLDATTIKKRAWLAPHRFILREILYFAVWSAIATYYRRNSIHQDATRDPRITENLQKWSGFCLVLLGLTLTGAAYDLIMSLDPHFYSTIFGGYFFAGGTLGFFATLILIINALQQRGWLVESINTEHYHDMGKYLFAFTFFWGYIAFSQFMLLWYASFPETITWLSRRGATTNPLAISGWTVLALLLLFGGLLIPFAGLLSRHVKRNRKALVFWAGWVLVFHYVDMYWCIMPEIGPKLIPNAADLMALVGIGGVVVATWCHLSSGHALRPTADPRLPESLAFHNL